MIDDPWIPEFEPRLLDLRQLPLEEFKDSKRLEELFFQPLLEICKFPDRAAASSAGFPSWGTSISSAMT